MHAFPQTAEKNKSSLRPFWPGGPAAGLGHPGHNYIITHLHDIVSHAKGASAMSLHRIYTPSYSLSTDYDFVHRTFACFAATTWSATCRHNSIVGCFFKMINTGTSTPNCFRNQ